MATGLGISRRSNRSHLAVGANPMTPEEMQDMIDNCVRIIDDCTRWIALLKDGWVAHPVGDTSMPGTITTDADEPCYLDASGKLVALGK